MNLGFMTSFEGAVLLPPNPQRLGLPSLESRSYLAIQTSHLGWIKGAGWSRRWCVPAGSSWTILIAGCHCYVNVLHESRAKCLNWVEKYEIPRTLDIWPTNYARVASIINMLTTELHHQAGRSIGNPFHSTKALVRIAV